MDANPQGLVDVLLAPTAGLYVPDRCTACVIGYETMTGHVCRFDQLSIGVVVESQSSEAAQCSTNVRIRKTGGFSLFLL